MTTPKDYEVQVRVKNNWLLTAMRRKGCETAADLSRLTGVNQGTIGDLLNLSTTFMLQNGEWKKSVLMISAALCCLPEELAPPQHIEDPLEKNNATFEASVDEITDFIDHRREYNPLELIEMNERRDVINQALLHRLSPQEHEVIELLYGLNGREEMTAIEIAEKLNINRSYVFALRDRALCRLRGSTPPHQGREKKKMTLDDIKRREGRRQSAVQSLVVLKQFESNR